jgi:hypothetical protein
MDENLTSQASCRISGKLSPVCRVLAIRDRMPDIPHEFHTINRVRSTLRASPRPTQQRTNAYEIAV